MLSKSGARSTPGRSAPFGDICNGSNGKHKEMRSKTRARSASGLFAPFWGMCKDSGGNRKEMLGKSGARSAPEMTPFWVSRATEAN